ncbi:MAG: guanosine polyphosphate pyrophosphohydrolase, partial [Legionellales bacterium]
MEDILCWEDQFVSCRYSARLLSKLSLLHEKYGTPIDLGEIKKAIYYARKYHGTQLRKSGEPFYSHPLEVAAMVADYLFRTDIIIVSILHDTVEDTEMTVDMISTIFDDKIAEQVFDLTRIKTDGKISSAELVEMLWHEKKYEVLLIKQFDRLHNMLTIGAKSWEKIKKTNSETISTFIVLAAYLG